MTATTLHPSSGVSLNTSGQGRDAIVPDEIKRWNWGAFLFQNIWLRINGLGGSRTMQNIYGGDNWSYGILLNLGSRGNELAWRYKHWESVDAFLRIQNRWSRVAATILVVFALTVVFLLVAAVVSVLKRHA